MSIRIEQYDGGEVLYIALDPDGVWASSDFPDELVTVDFNGQGRVIGIEVVGDLARSGAEALLSTIATSEALQDHAAVRESLKTLV